jgi:P-type conjugative transfer protein TrbJ
MSRLICALMLVLGIAAPVRATVVFDPSNYSQNVLTAARTLEQINNQVKSLQNQAQSLLNQARNLTSLNFSALNDLKQTMAQTQALIDQAKGLTFNMTQAEQTFARLYPQQYAATTGSVQLAADARERWTNSLSAFETTLKVQNQLADNLKGDDQTLSNLVTASQSSVGLLQAIQATNQLLALQAKQTIDAGRMKLSQDRAVAIEQARTLAEDERSRQVRSKFQGSGTTSYAPEPIHIFRE